jgi:hypothetical protein
MQWEGKTGNLLVATFLQLAVGAALIYKLCLNVLGR